MSLLFESILNEQKVTNTNRMYYHGSPHCLVTNKLRTGCRDQAFITTDVNYAASYALKSNNDTGWVYLVKIDKELNVFNFRSKKDTDKLIKLIRDNSMKIKDDELREQTHDRMYKLMELVPRLANEDWYEVLDKTSYERFTLLHFIAQLGYDGFFNFETHWSMDAKPSIGLNVEHKKGSSHRSEPIPYAKILKRKRVIKDNGEPRLVGPWEDLTMKKGHIAPNEEIQFYKPKYDKNNRETRSKKT